VLAARQNVPAALYEAAEVDGANRWQGFWRITLPLIRPLAAAAGMPRPGGGGAKHLHAVVRPGLRRAILCHDLPAVVDLRDLVRFRRLGLASAVLVVVYVLDPAAGVGIRNLIEGLRGRVESGEG